MSPGHVLALPRLLALFAARELWKLVLMGAVLFSTQAAWAQAGPAPNSNKSESGEPQAEYLVELWSTGEGLPNNTVSAIAQTPDGYLWCGTYDGLVHFDGVRFVRMNLDGTTNQEANRIQCLYVDRRGTLWVGTDGAGSLRLDQGRLTAFRDEPGSPFDVVRCLTEDASGHLWIGTRGGIGRWSEGGIQWFTDGAGYTNSARSIWNFAFDHDSHLWIADWNGLKVFKENRFESAVIRPTIEPPLRTVYTDASGTMWAGMLGHALHQDASGEWFRVQDPTSAAASGVVAFCQTRSGIFLVGTRKGLCRLQDGQLHPFNTGDDLGRSEVRVIFEDRENNIWVGTGTKGLARLKPRVLKTYAGRHGLTDDRVFALREKPQGGLWVGLQDGRLVEQVGDEFRSSPEVSGLPSDAPVETVLQSRDGALWVGTFGNGLIRFQNGRPTHLRPSIGSPARIDKITALLEDRAGTVWVGSFYSLYKAGTSNLVVPVLVEGRELRAPVTALLESRAGDVWVAFHGIGIVRLTDDTTHWLTRRDGLPTSLVRTLHEDGAGTLWIGTEAGLSCWRQGRLSTFTEQHGLVDDTISQILEDDAANLWLGSNRGLMRIAKAELNAVAEGRKSTLDVFACGRGDGLMSLECSGGFYPAGLRTTDGRLWFPTAKGLVMVDPSQLKLTMNMEPPPVYIEEVRVDGKVVLQPHLPSSARDRAAHHPHLALPPSTRRLEFAYTAPSLTAPERVRFRHRLDGFDPDWTDAGGARSAVYARLPAGRYLFQVIACNHDGVWNQVGDSLGFRIAAPFWRQWWFLAALVIAFAGLLAGSVRAVSVRQLRRKLQRLEEAHAVDKERMRIAQDMHDQIGGQLSRISFLSDIARRNVPDASQASEQIDEVAEAAREVIRTVDEIVWAVSPRNDTLESLTHYISRHAEEFFELTPIELELELPLEFPADRLSAEMRHNLFSAVKEALTNALKHANATKVRIGFQIDPPCFRVTVSDNGQGFASAPAMAAAGSVSSRTGGRTGNGLFNMRDRMEQIGGQCLIESAPGQGTRAVFTVPLH